MLPIDTYQPGVLIIYGDISCEVVEGEFRMKMSVRAVCRAIDGLLGLLPAAAALVVAAWAPAYGAVLWSSGCDSTEGWATFSETVTWPSIVTTSPIHSGSGAWAYTNRQNRVYQSFTPTNGPVALRFWLYDSNLSYSGDAPIAHIHTGSGSFTAGMSAGVSTSPIGGTTRYAFKLNDNGVGGWVCGTAQRSVGWHRLEVVYKNTSPRNACLYVDGVLSYTKAVNNALTFGAVSVGMGLSSSPYSDDFRCDTMAVLGAPRLLTFAATGGDIAVSVGGVQFAQKDGFYDEGETICLTATPNPGCSFAGWNSTAGGAFANPSSPVTTFSGATGAGTITATFVSGATAVDKISDLWPLTNGPSYKLTDKVVTGVVGNAFWIEETNRSAAIKVVYAGAMPVQGNKVDVSGVLDSSSGQRVLNATSWTDKGAGTAIAPLGVIERAAGGKGVNANTPAISGGTGLYNVGMLVRIAGSAGNSSVSDPNNKYFYLDDGSGLVDGAIPGIKVLCGTNAPKTSGNVTVTGLVGVVGGKPVIIIRGAGDIP